MKINILTKDIELSLALENFINEKINSLDKLVQGFLKRDENLTAGKRAIIEMNFEIGRTTAHHNKGKVYRAEGTLFLPGTSLRSEAEAEDLRLAIVMVKDELQRQIKQYKEKQIDLVNKGAREFKEEYINSTKEAEEEEME